MVKSSILCNQITRLTMGTKRKIRIQNFPDNPKDVHNLSLDWITYHPGILTLLDHKI